MAHITLPDNVQPAAVLRGYSAWKKWGGIAHYEWLSIALVGLFAFAGSVAVGLIFGLRAPKTHDEFSYLLAGNTFAQLRLTNHTHPMWPHFESFHIIQRPTYMSKYPPAQGMMLAAGQILGGHPIVGVWLSFALMCAAICWMLFAWVPHRWALFGGLLAVIHPVLGMSGYWAQSYWGGAVAAGGGSLVLGAVRRLIRRARVRDAVFLSLGLAILANSRPYEGILLSLPCIVVLAFHLIGKDGPPVAVSFKRVFLPIVIILTLTSAAMGFYHFRVAGNVLRIPYQIHEKTYGIAPLFIWQGSRPEPAYVHQVIQDFQKDICLTYYTSQRSIAGFLSNKLTFFLSWVFHSGNVYLIPLIATFTMLAGWTLRNRWALFAGLSYAVLMLGVFMETYTHPSYLHYLAPILGLNYVFVLNAMRLWCRHNKKAGRLALAAMPLLATAVLVKYSYDAVKQANPSAWHVQRAGLLTQLTQHQGKHLVMVSYGSSHSPHNEWVYNEADIDGAKVVWARQMGMGENCNLLKYFKERHVWRLEVDKDDSVPIFKPYLPNLCGKLSGG